MQLTLIDDVITKEVRQYTSREVGARETELVESQFFSFGDGDERVCGILIPNYDLVFLGPSHTAAWGQMNFYRHKILDLAATQRTKHLTLRLSDLQDWGLLIIVDTDIIQIRAHAHAYCTINVKDFQGFVDFLLLSATVESAQAIPTFPANEIGLN